MNVPLSSEEFSLVAAFILDCTGIVLDSHKDYLVQNRLNYLLDEHGVTNFRDLVRIASLDESRFIINQIINAITTNETSFFRDKKPFDLLVHKLVPDIIELRAPYLPGIAPRIDIWSAACSTGQEVYSIAMALKELLFDFKRYRIRILGTDISEAALAVASRGLYTNHELSRGLSDRRKSRFFHPDKNGWSISDELRAATVFKILNITKSFRHIGTYDIIFCRNVAIYFSVEDRRSLFEGLCERLRPGGKLVIGSTESLINITGCFQKYEFHGTAYYERSI